MFKLSIDTFFLPRISQNKLNNVFFQFGIYRTFYILVKFDFDRWNYGKNWIWLFCTLVMCWTNRLLLATIACLVQWFGSWPLNQRWSLPMVQIPKDSTGYYQSWFADELYRSVKYLNKKSRTFKHIWERSHGKWREAEGQKRPNLAFFSTILAASFHSCDWLLVIECEYLCKGIFKFSITDQIHDSNW